jgi:signal transduction histidine kinase
VLGRSLVGLRDLADSSLSDIRLAAVQHRCERMPVAAFVKEVANSGSLHAEYRGLQFAVDAVDPTLEVDIDPQLLGSAVTNLLNNAFKFSRPGGRVGLRAQRQGERVLIEVEDECGGLPDTVGDPFQAFGERRGKDRTGLGLGLSIARKAARVHGGDIHFHNRPGKGCIFVIDLPLAGTALGQPALDLISAP